MERANSAVIDSHFVAGVDIFHSFASSAPIQPSNKPHPFKKLLQEEEAEQAWPLISLWENCFISTFRGCTRKEN